MASAEVEKLVRQKTDEIVAMFKGYVKGKMFSSGTLGLEAMPDETGYAAIIRVEILKANATSSYSALSRVLRAYYDHEEDSYKLDRYSPPIGPRGRGQTGAPPDRVATYASAEQLMKAIESELARL
jgi:hypothetical protein